MFAKKLLLDLLGEDVGKGDVTSEAVVPAGADAVGEVIANQSGIVAGLGEAAWLCRKQGLNARILVKDGAFVRKGAKLLRVEGKARGILTVERSILNLVGRMSGIATMARRAVELAGSGIEIAATRKTMWGPLDKKAVKLGGGWPHRWRLDDGILIKTNHLRFVGVEEAVRKAKRKGRVEVEALDERTALKAAKAGADVVMLDNFPVGGVGSVVRMLRRSNPKTKIELSGGINLENLRDYVKCKPDIISIGALTHSAKWFDVSLRIR